MHTECVSERQRGGGDKEGRQREKKGEESKDDSVGKVLRVQA